MCISRIGQIAYGGLSLISIGLIIGSIFTPAWRQVTTNLQQGQLGQLPPLNMGLFAFACQQSNTVGNNQYLGGNYGNINTNNGQYGTGFTTGYNTINQGLNTVNQGINQGYNTINNGYNQLQQQGGYNTGTNAFNLDLCLSWWNNQPVFEKIVVGMMILALISAVASFIWNLLTFCACFCQGSIMKPLPGLASISFICLLIAVIIYWSKNNTSIDQFRGTNTIQMLSSQSDISYSFYLACGAGVASLINVVVGALIIFLADKCL